MRILNRPMFRYGGPIKEGVMHGMRNNYASGQRVMPSSDGSRPGYGGPAVLLPWLWGTGARLLGGQAVKKVGQNIASQAGKKVIQGSTPANIRGAFDIGSKKIVDKVAPAATTGWKNLGKNWFSGDPLVKGSRWGWKTLTSPGANTLAQKAVKTVISPSSIIAGVAWYMWPDGKERKTPPPGGATGPKPWEANEGMYYKKPPVTKSAEELAAEAKAARTKKLNKYLDTMGYDKAKSTAMGDALIDASAIVQGATDEAGSLKKADWGKMINQAIQTTSKRLDKPEQIREAVGLMMTKADIEKDLEDPQVKRLRALQIEDAEEKLDRGFEKDMREFILARKEAPDKNQLERFARLTADEYGIAFKKVDEKELEGLPEGATDEEIMTAVVGEDGIYMIGQTIVRVKDGIPKQIG